MPTTRVLALDLGTSSGRALVLDGDASPVPHALARHKGETAYASGGADTPDLEGYVEGVLGCVHELNETGFLDGVEHIVLSSQWHSVVALDNDGGPLTPVVPWPDPRSVPRRTGDDFDERAFHAR